jgi:hypothetical protein
MEVDSFVRFSAVLLVPVRSLSIVVASLALLASLAALLIALACAIAEPSIVLFERKTSIAIGLRLLLLLLAQ